MKKNGFGKRTAQSSLEGQQAKKRKRVTFDGFDNDMMTLIQIALDAERRENEKRDREQGMTDDDDFEPERGLIQGSPPRGYAGPPRVHQNELHPSVVSYTPPDSPTYSPTYSPPTTPGYHPYSPVSPTDSPLRWDGYFPSGEPPLTQEDWVRINGERAV